MTTLRERIDWTFEHHPQGAASGYKSPPPTYPAKAVAWVAEQTGASWRSVYDWCAGKHAAPQMFLRQLERLEAEAQAVA